MLSMMWSDFVLAHSILKLKWLHLVWVWCCHTGCRCLTVAIEDGDSPHIFKLACADWWLNFVVLLGNNILCCFHGLVQDRRSCLMVWPFWQTGQLTWYWCRMWRHFPLWWMGWGHLWLLVIVWVCYWCGGMLAENCLCPQLHWVVLEGLCWMVAHDMPSCADLKRLTLYGSLSVRFGPNSRCSSDNYWQRALNKKSPSTIV